MSVQLQPKYNAQRLFISWANCLHLCNGWLPLLMFPSKVKKPRYSALHCKNEMSLTNWNWTECYRGSVFHFLRSHGNSNKQGDQLEIPKFFCENQDKILDKTTGQLAFFRSSVQHSTTKPLLWLITSRMSSIRFKTHWFAGCTISRE